MTGARIAMQAMPLPQVAAIQPKRTVPPPATKFPVAPISWSVSRPKHRIAVPIGQIAGQAKRAWHSPPFQTSHQRTVQPMMYTKSSGSGGFGDDEDFPRKWRPDDKVGRLIHMPRTKMKGGKHFIPANWIDRMLALVVELSGTLGRLTDIMSDIQDIVDDEAPLELSFYPYTHSSVDPYVSLTNTTEKGFFQVFSQKRDALREFEENLFPNDVESSGDGGGRQIDMPDVATPELVGQLAEAARRIIEFFDARIGRSDRKVSVPLTGSDREVTWLELRWLITQAVITLRSREKA